MLTTNTGRHNRQLWPLALFILTLFALGMRWYYVSTALVLGPVRGDAMQYVAYAWNLMTHHTFAKDLAGSTTITPDNYRDPGYPFFLALTMKGFGTGDAWYVTVLLCQALLGALTVMLVTQLGKCWLSSRWAFCAGILMAVWPHSIAINGYLLTETLFGFLCALGLFFFVLACRRESTYFGLIAGITLGAAALTNAVLLPFGIFLAGFLAWRKLASRALCIALIAGALLLPGAWAIRNTQLPKISSSSSLGRAMENFAQGASPDFHAAYRDLFYGGAISAKAKAKASITIHAVDTDYALLRASPFEGVKAFWQKIEKQPWRYALWYLFEKPYELWSWDIAAWQRDIYVYPTTNSPFMTNRGWMALEAACQALNLPLLLMSAASLIFAWSQDNFKKFLSEKPGSRTALISVFLLSIFITMVYSLLQAEPRYSIPFRPFEILLAFTSFVAAHHFWSMRNRLADQTPLISP